MFLKLSRTVETGRICPFAEPSGNAGYLRIPAIPTGYQTFGFDQ
jgi:hypothetical protein